LLFLHTSSLDQMENNEVSLFIMNYATFAA